MYTKNLGAESALLITTLASQGQSVFSIADAQKASGKDYTVVLQELRRLVKSGWVVKLRPGLYALVPLSAGAEANWRLHGKNIEINGGARASGR